MTALTIRPSSWDLALFVHVAGAMLVVAALVVAVAGLGLAWRAEGDERRKLTRFGFFTLLCAAIPAYIMMRGGAQWVLSKEGLDDSEATWVGVGFGTSDLGALLLLLATLLTGLGQRRMVSGRGGGMAKVGTTLSGIVVVLFLIAIWAMTTKPV